MDNKDLEEQLHVLLEFFTEPGTGEKYLRDLETDLLGLIHKAEIEATLKAKIECNNYFQGFNKNVTNWIETDISELQSQLSEKGNE